MTTREQTCSTTSSTCELNTTILPSAAIERTKRFQDPCGADIEPGKRLVEHDDARVVEDGSGDEDLLPHALGVRRERLVAIVPDAEQRKKPLDLVVECGIGHPAKAADQLQVRGRSVGIEMRLFRGLTRGSTCSRHVGERVPSVEQDVAAGRRQETGQDFDRGALAGPIRSQQTKHFAGTNFERQVVNGRQAIAPHQTADFDHRRLDTARTEKARPSASGVKGKPASPKRLGAEAGTTRMGSVPSNGSS